MNKIHLVPKRCVGCEECLIACEKAHDWQTRVFVEVVDGYFPFPMRCQHCQDAPCKAACPTGAIQRADSGAVVVDMSRCIGCGTCGVVCPFGVPFVSQQSGKVVKCDQCDDRVSQGLQPVCVDACPKGALSFGEAPEVYANRRQQLARQARLSLAP